jgi:hypothetical protein
VAARRATQLHALGTEPSYDLSEITDAESDVINACGDPWTKFASTGALIHHFDQLQIDCARTNEGRHDAELVYTQLTVQLEAQSAGEESLSFLDVIDKYSNVV